MACTGAGHGSPTPAMKPAASKTTTTPAARRQLGCSSAARQNSSRADCCASFYAASEPSSCWRSHCLAKTDSCRFQRSKRELRVSRDHSDPSRHAKGRKCGPNPGDSISPNTSDVASMLAVHVSAHRLSDSARALDRNTGARRRPLAVLISSTLLITMSSLRDIASDFGRIHASLIARQSRDFLADWLPIAGIAGCRARRLTSLVCLRSYFRDVLCQHLARDAALR